MSARKTDAMASVAPQVTVISVSVLTAKLYHFRYFSAIASRSDGDPHVIAYWLTSPWIAAAAAFFIGSGMGKSGKPWARLIAPCWCASRVISRMTLSVNVAVRSEGIGANRLRDGRWEMGDLRSPALR